MCGSVRAVCGKWGNVWSVKVVCGTVTALCRECMEIGVYVESGRWEVYGNWRVCGMLNVWGVCRGSVEVCGGYVERCREWRVCGGCVEGVWEYVGSGEEWESVETGEYVEESGECVGSVEECGGVWRCVAVSLLQGGPLSSQ